MGEAVAVEGTVAEIKFHNESRQNTVTKRLKLACVFDTPKRRRNDGSFAPKLGPKYLN
jgi:hypothetical protein